MALPREKVWFKNMQPLVEENIKNCYTCQISTHKPTREPLQMSPLPAAPWAEVSVDFGHLQNGKYLLFVTDKYSRYVVATSWRASLPQNRQRLTIQQPQIQNLCLHHRIQTQDNNALTAPGQCWNRTLHAHCKKSIKTALNKDQSWKQELFKFLLDYHWRTHSHNPIWLDHKKPPATPDHTYSVAPKPREQ